MPDVSLLRQSPGGPDRTQRRRDWDDTFARARRAQVLIDAVERGPTAAELIAVSARSIEQARRG